MTRYEVLKNKAERCRQAAGRTTGKMKTIWLQKAADLEIECLNMPLTTAAKQER